MIHHFSSIKSTTDSLVPFHKVVFRPISQSARLVFFFTSLAVKPLLRRCSSVPALAPDELVETWTKKFDKRGKRDFYYRWSEAEVPGWWTYKAIH